MMRFIKYWLPIIAYAILIFCLSSLPGKDIPRIFTGQDVVLHIIEYSIFALLINRAFKEYCPHQKRASRAYLVFILAIIYAISDEWHQSFVPGRFPSVYDVVFDSVGIFVANLFYPVRKPRPVTKKLCDGTRHLWRTP